MSNENKNRHELIYKYPSWSQADGTDNMAQTTHNQAIFLCATGTCLPRVHEQMFPL